MKREKWQHQDSGVEPDVKGKVSEKEREVCKQVGEVIHMPGYGILHGMFVEMVESGTKRVLDPGAEEKDIRYWQGVVAGITQVQRSFVALGREEENDA